MTTVKVWFSETCRFEQVALTDATRRDLSALKIVDGVYLASLRGDYLALRPHAVREVK